MCSLEVSIPKVYRDTFNYSIVVRKLKMVSRSSIFDIEFNLLSLL